MTTNALLFSHRELPLQWIEIKHPTPTQPTRFVKLGFTSLQQSGIKNLVSSLMQSMDGGSSTSTSLAIAQEYAATLTAKFSIPCKVEKQIKIGINQQESCFHQNPATGKKELLPGIDPESVYEPVALKIKNLTKIREMIQFCEETLSIMHVADRALLTPFLKSLEASLKEDALLQPTITQAQTDTLQSIAEPYIDAIIEACDQLSNGASLLGRASRYLNADNTFQANSTRDLAFAILIQSMQESPETLYREQTCGLEEQIASAKELHSLYYAQREHSLEKALSSLGSHIPDVKARRRVLLEFIEQKLDEKFGKDVATEIDGFNSTLVNDLRNLLFIEGRQLNTVKLLFETKELKISLNETTLLALQGKLGTDEHYILWDSGNPKVYGLTKEQVQQEVARLRQQVEQRLAPNPL